MAVRPRLPHRRNGWLLLDACPECGRLVPAARVATLADLGEYLDSDGDPFTGLPLEFHDDPAHRPDCPIRLY